MCETQPSWTPHQVQAVTAAPCYQCFGKASFYKNKRTPNQPRAPLLIQSLQPIKETDSPINWFHLQSNDTVMFEPILWSWSSLWSVSNEAFSELFVASDMLTYSTVDEESIADIGTDPSCLPSHPSRGDCLPSRTAQLHHDSASEPLQFMDQHIKPS